MYTLVFQLPRGFRVNSSLAQDKQLWHQRLADTCHMSKFTRLPLGLSSIKTSKVFELYNRMYGDQLLDSLMAINTLLLF